MANGTYKLVKENSSGYFDEKGVLAESGKALGFDSSLNPVMVEVGGGGLIDINNQTGTTYTLQATDAGKLVTCNNENAITVTIPKDTFNVKDIILLDQKGAGQITVAGATDVTVNGYGGLSSAGQYAALSLYCIDTNVWRVYGGASTDAALVFEFSEGNAPESMAINLTFAEGYSFADLTETKSGDMITLTGEALAKITQLNLSQLANLVSISSMECLISLTEFICSNCTSLSSLPVLPPSLSAVDCSNCTSLTALPALPSSLTDLDCTGCTFLSSLPVLPTSLQGLGCDNCTSLSSLPVLPPSLIYFSCRYCKLTSNLMDAAVATLDGSGQENGYFIWSPQANLAEPNQAAQSYLNLIAKGWSFVD